MAVGRLPVQTPDLPSRARPATALLRVVPAPESTTSTPPNRTVAGSAVIGVIVTALVSLLGAVPDTWKGPVLIACIVCATAVGIVWLLGWQKHEARRDGPPVMERF